MIGSYILDVLSIWMSDLRFYAKFDSLIKSWRLIMCQTPEITTIDHASSYKNAYRFDWSWHQISCLLDLFQKFNYLPIHKIQYLKKLIWFSKYYCPTRIYKNYMLWYLLFHFMSKYSSIFCSTCIFFRNSKLCQSTLIGQRQVLRPMVQSFGH